MKRREFLRLGGLSALGGVPTVAAASTDVIDERAVEIAALNMDAGITSIRAKISKRIEQEQALGDNPALKEAMRTLLGGYYAYQAFNELPLEIQVHPDIQDRILTASGDIDTGVDALKVALQASTAAEIDALEQLWNSGYEQGISDADLAYAKHGGTLRGRRRFMRLADMAGRDIRRKGLQGTFDQYFEEIDALRADPPTPPAPSEETVARVQRARKHWERRGAGRRSDVVPAKNPGLAKAIGITLVVIGSVITAFGLLFVWCPCVGLPIMAVGIILIVIGAWQIRKGDAGLRLSRDGGPDDEDEDEPEETEDEPDP